MKKIFLIAAAGLLSLAASAQNRYYDDRYGAPAGPGRAVSTLDLHIGEGLGIGEELTAGAGIAVLHKFSPAFSLGAGSGLDYAKVLSERSASDGQKTNEYWGELSLPLFVRGRYVFGRRGMYNYGHGPSYYRESYSHPREGTHAFMQYDLGYRFCLSALDFSDSSDKTVNRGHLKGFFFEPQLGIAFGRSTSLAIGFPFQGYDKVNTDSSSERKVVAAATIHISFNW